ncbi:hypothetical protein JXL19_02605 [bacterium]|nr:hypothetical protein [bacterium]
MTEKEVIAQMLLVEQQACKIIEDAKNEANKDLVDARNEYKKLIADTKNELNEDANTLTERMQAEAERDILDIRDKKQGVIDIIDRQYKKKKDLAFKKVRKVLFEDYLSGL